MNEETARKHFAAQGGTLESFEFKKDHWNFSYEALVDFAGDLQVWSWSNNLWTKIG